MNPWGKVIGGVAGLLVGGPVGAVVGLLLGHSVDTGVGPLLRGGSLVYLQHAFFETTFRTMGHLSKADGRVSEQEVAYAEALMTRMALDRAARRRAIQLFNEGKQPHFEGIDAVVAFARISRGQDQLRRLLLEILTETATADGRLKPEGRAFLKRAAQALGVGASELDSMLARRSAPQAPVDPYAVLGVARQASIDDIKRAYRRLVSRHHPDKLVSQGLPPEMMEVAAQKTREIRAAYDQIRKERGL